MSNNRKNIIVIELEGERLCPICSTPMERRKHKEITPRILGQAYYFSEWDFCTNCFYLQYYKQFIVLKEKEEERNPF